MKKRNIVPLSLLAMIISCAAGALHGLNPRPMLARLSYSLAMQFRPEAPEPIPGVETIYVGDMLGPQRF